METKSYFSDLEQIEVLINYLAAEYNLPKNKEWRFAGFKASKEILRISQEQMNQDPWIEWRSLWEWFDRVHGDSDKTFLDRLQESGDGIPYPEVARHLRNSMIGVYQVVGMKDKNYITLQDIITLEEIPVYIDAEDLCLPWSIMIGRLYPMEAGLWTGVQTWVTFPPYFKVIFQDWLNNQQLTNEIQKRKKEILKKYGLDMIRIAIQPSSFVEEEFLLIMEQFQEILLEDRGLFDKNIEKLPVETQIYIYETLYYTIWLSAIRVESQQLYFPWEKELQQLGRKGIFQWNSEIQKQLKKNLEDQEVEEVEEA